jgi:hypothetical protein
MNQSIQLTTTIEGCSVAQFCDLQEMFLTMPDTDTRAARSLYVCSNYQVLGGEWMAQDAETVKDALKKVLPLIASLHNRRVDVPKYLVIFGATHRVPSPTTDLLTFEGLHACTDWTKSHEYSCNVRFGAYILAVWLCQKELSRYDDDRVNEFYESILLEPVTTVEGVANFFTLILTERPPAMWHFWLGSPTLRAWAKPLKAMASKKSITV